MVISYHTTANSQGRGAHQVEGNATAKRVIDCTISPVSSHGGTSQSVTPTSSPIEPCASSQHNPRTMVYLERKILEPSHAISKCLKSIFPKKIAPKGYTWKNILQDVIDFYWGEFLKDFYWDVKTLSMDLWISKARRQYTLFLSSLKKQKEKPNNLKAEDWAEFQLYWESPEAVRISKIKFDNRNSGEEITWTGGSLNLNGHVKKLTQQKGGEGEASFQEAFVHCFTAKHDGRTFVNKKAKLVYEQVKEYIADLSQPLSDTDEVPEISIEDKNLAFTKGVRLLCGKSSRTKKCFAAGSSSTSLSEQNVLQCKVNEQATEIKGKAETIQKMEEKHKADMQNLRDENLKFQEMVFAPINPTSTK